MPSFRRKLPAHVQRYVRRLFPAKNLRRKQNRGLSMANLRFFVRRNLPAEDTTETYLRIRRHNLSVGSRWHQSDFLCRICTLSCSPEISAASRRLSHLGKTIENWASRRDREIFNPTMQEKGVYGSSVPVSKEKQFTFPVGIETHTGGNNDLMVWVQWQRLTVALGGGDSTVA
ncbi:hypothetical protein MA16_Dca002888 [Dendrobium catenatum]|uniref:Uncharacterized protein n=1 Tax=Dendrobium catenatum TaxID=906689 RepID=A0A2I0X8Y6_9ASPA|nr:hypothetical protein MA16_Dca002888 [Dendrobium catenatum]